MIIQKHCFECGALLIEKEHEEEGMTPYCPECGKFRHPMYNTAVSMIVRNRTDGRILLIQQYGRPWNILVAGYVNRGENAESAVAREVREETSMNVKEIHFNRTRFFEPSNTLMCNFTAWVDDDSELNTNSEVDAFNWFEPSEARNKIKPDSLAQFFLNAYLDETLE